MQKCSAAGRKFMETLCVHTVEHVRFERLDQNIKTDILIIGVGMVGILCTYLMHEVSIPYVMSEKKDREHSYVLPV